MKNKVDRRSFLKTSVLSSGGLMLSFTWLSSFTQGDKLTDLNIQDDWKEINGYIQITPDNKVKIKCPNPEFGQNVMTSLPMIVAEELDVDWNGVSVEIAPFDASIYFRQFSGGSQSVRQAWKPLRIVGASARQMLMQAAANDWGTALENISTSKGIITFKDKKATYGDFALKAAKIEVPAEPQLKEVQKFKIVGDSKKNVEGLKVVTGKPLFGVDYKKEGMLIAMVQHPPAFGMKLKSFDASSVKEMPGIKEVFSIKVFDENYERGLFDTRTFNELIAIVGDSTWQVMNAKKNLKAVWEPIETTKSTINVFGNKVEELVPGGLESTTKQFEAMRERAQKEAKVLRKDGDPEGAFKNAAKVLERTYSAPFLAHNTMEPMNFFADVQENNATLAGPLQAPIFAEKSVSDRIGIPIENIEIIMTRMGGGFGRRAYGHYLVEAALISQKVKAPIKLIYKREDDMTYGIYRPMYTATYRAAIDANNKVVGFHVRGGGIPEHPIAANRFPAGAVDNYLAEGWEIPTNLTIGAFRAPRSNFNAAAEQSFLDELAELIGKDPIEFRLELLERAKNNPVGEKNDYDADRYAGVLKLVKEKSKWNDPSQSNYHRGVAAYFCHNSYAAHVVDMLTRDGVPYVEKVTSAMDCGIVINPDAAKNMVQGAVIDGIGNAFYGALTIKDGVPDQNNFDKYRMIRHNEAPKKVDVYFVENEIEPTGLGEPPFPPVFGAVANALYKNTGKRHYSQPFLNDAINS